MCFILSQWETPWSILYEVQTAPWLDYTSCIVRTDFNSYAQVYKQKNKKNCKIPLNYLQEWREIMPDDALQYWECFSIYKEAMYT